MQTMNQQPTPNTMGTQNIPTQLNHGGHEVFDMHEILMNSVNAMDQYMMFQQFVKDPELMDILNRQHQFMLSQYNIMVECFRTGSKPSQVTSVYMMRQNNNVGFGLRPAQPKKPVHHLSELTDQCISGMMLGLMKANSGQLTFASLECTNPVVRRVLADSIPNYVEMAYELFLYQNKHQYYQVPQLSQSDMQQMLNGFAPVTGSQTQTFPNPNMMMQ